MLTLPRDIFQVLAKFLDSKERSYLRSTCKRLREKIQDTANCDRWAFYMHKKFECCSKRDHFSVQTHWTLVMLCIEYVSKKLRLRVFEFLAVENAPISVFLEFNSKYTEGSLFWWEFEDLYRTFESDHEKEEICEFFWHQVKILKPKKNHRAKKRKIKVDKEWI